MCLQTFHGVEKTPLFYYNNQHQEKRFGGSKKGIRFSKKFFETHRKPHGYWVPVISVTKDKQKRQSVKDCRFCFAVFHSTTLTALRIHHIPSNTKSESCKLPDGFKVLLSAFDAIKNKKEKTYEPVITSGQLQSKARNAKKLPASYIRLGNPQ